MTKLKSEPKAAARPARRTAKAGSRKRSPAASSKPKAGSNTKHARIIAMLRTPAGTTIAAIMKVSDWQQHSVRGFLAGVVRKRLNLKLSSEKVDGNRIYKIKGSDGGKPSARAAQRQPA